jgi:hypothetical protein
MVATCCPYSIVANKSRLEFMVRVRFAGMDAVSEPGKELLVLAQRASR